MDVISMDTYVTCDSGRVVHIHRPGDGDTATYERDYMREQLLTVLYRRCVLHGKYVTRMTDKSNGDGTRTLTVNYGNGTKDVFTIAN